MTAPIELAYEALGAKLAAALVAAEFLLATTDFVLNPTSPFEPTEPDAEDDGEGEPTVQVTASLVKLKTGPVRQILGRPTQRFVVERLCLLELSVFGGDAARQAALYDAAITAAAGVPVAFSTLEGLCEMLLIAEAEDDAIAPSGDVTSITFSIRLRSGDPLGRTA